MPSYSRKIDLPGKSAQELYDRVSQDIDHFMSKASIGKIEVYRNPGTKEVNVKASMVSATLVCRDGAMDLNAQLSLLAAPFRGKLDEAIDKWLAKTFKV